MIDVEKAGNLGKMYRQSEFERNKQASAAVKVERRVVDQKAVTAATLKAVSGLRSAITAFEELYELTLDKNVGDVLVTLNSTMGHATRN